MFVISKLFGGLFMTPFLFIFLWVLGLFFLTRNKNRIAFWLILIPLLASYLLSIRPLTNLLVVPLENTYQYNVPRVNCAALLVAGGGVINSSPEANGLAVLSDSSLHRTLAAYKIWRRLKVPIVLSGGSPFKNGQPEAEVMANYLAELGVPRKNLILETRSRNTYENIFYVKKLLQQYHWSELGVITSAVHLPRTVKILKYFKIKVIPIPTGYITERGNFGWFDLLPSAGNLEASYTALHEYVGNWYYHWRYKI